MREEMLALTIVSLILLATSSHVIRQESAEEEIAVLIPDRPKSIGGEIPAGEIESGRPRRQRRPPGALAIEPRPVNAAPVDADPATTKGDVDAQLAGIDERIRNYEAERESLEAGEVTLSILANDSRVISMKDRLYGAELALARMERDLTPIHPRIQEARELITAARFDLESAIITAMKDEEVALWSKRRALIARSRGESLGESDSRTESAVESVALAAGAG